MPVTNPDRRDVVIARVLVGAAVAGVAVIALRSPVVRRLLWRGAKFAAVTWLPAFVAGQVRGAWDDASPAPALVEASPALAAEPERASVPATPAVPAFAPPPPRAD